MSDTLRAGVVRHDDDTLITFGTYKEAMFYVAGLVPELRTSIDTLRSLNLGEGMEWYAREQLRTIQGKLDGALDACADFMDRIGTDDADEILRELWPDVYND